MASVQRGAKKVPKPQQTFINVISMVIQSLDSDVSMRTSDSTTLAPSISGKSIIVHQQVQEKGRAQSDALSQGVLIYYPRFISSNELLRIVRHEMRGGRHAVGAARLLRLWISLRYEVDFRQREVLHKLIELISRRSIRSQSAAPLHPGDTLGLLIREVNSVKLSLLRAARQVRSNVVPKISPLRLEVLEEIGVSGTLRTKMPLLRRFLGMAAPQAASLLTLIDCESFGSINLVEFYDQGWKEQQRSPRLSGFVARIIRISQWVASSILVQSSVSLSSRVASDFIRIAYFCYQNGNYASSLAIMQAFDLSYVSRLRRLWKFSEETRAMAKQIEQIGQHKDNYKAYRTELRKRRDAGQGSIPMLAVHQRDLTMIEEGNPDYLPDGSANAEKVILLGQSLCELAYLQRTQPSARLQYDDADTAMRHLLESLPCKSDGDLEMRSEELRPRANQNSVEDLSFSWASSSDRPTSARSTSDESSLSGGSADELIDV